MIVSDSQQENINFLIKSVTHAALITASAIQQSHSWIYIKIKKKRKRKLMSNGIMSQSQVSKEMKKKMEQVFKQ